MSFDTGMGISIVLAGICDTHHHQRGWDATHIAQKMQLIEEDNGNGPLNAERRERPYGRCVLLTQMRHALALWF